MKFHALLLVFFVMFFSANSLAQTGTISFSFWDEKTNQKVDSVSIINLNTNNEVLSNQGESSLELPIGIYSFEFSHPTYENTSLYEIEVKNNTKLTYDISLQSIKTELKEVVIQLKTFSKTAESPLSLRNLSTEEITRNPGSNRDISKVIQSFPGVTSVSSFRNDLLIRGGGPSENRFFIDKIETPVINHFATQGASGGPKGIINVDFLRDVDFYSGAFPVNRGNALSSVFDFTFRNPKDGTFHGKAVVGFDDMSVMAEGKLLEDKSLEYVASIRKSNLQLLFKAIGLPFLPTYYDFQTKIQKRFTNGDKLYFLGIGAIDNFELNFDAEKTEENEFTLDAVPVAPQRNYTIGFVYEKRQKNGNWNFVISRNQLDNKATKYYKNIEIHTNLLYDYHSIETDNRVRIERKFSISDFDFLIGIGSNFSSFYNNSFRKYVDQNEVYTDVYESELDFTSYSFFAQSAKRLFQNKVKLSFGARFDGNSYNQSMQKITKQFSPRFAISYQFIPKWSLNANAGIYYQLPQYTAMGFQENGILVNENSLNYVQNKHLTIGIEHITNQKMKISVESFYKKYSDYPVSTRNGLSLANFGGDFGIIGIEPIESIGKGRSYGLELLVQQRLSKSIYGTFAYTFANSEFTNTNSEYEPSSWDSRHIIALTAGKKLAKNWEIGFRFRMQSALPQTPYDLYRSSFVTVWNINNSALTDYSLLNKERGEIAHQMDVRVEKKWNFTKWTLSAYADIINIYGGSSGNTLSIVTLQKDSAGNPIIVNPTDSPENQRYELKISEAEKPTTLPYIGIIVEF